ncbi:MAG: phospho-sugar mutase, partial [Pseudothermotoga sp.]|nr:phospho-sugar mutase [Pseudothermotoga sp.]
MILFGTGGVRGIMRDGEFDEKLIVDVWMYEEKLDGVVIAYDTRRNSNRFAKLAAQTFADCGIETYLFDAPTPTPLLSFAVRELRVGAGVVITASHNPPQYNGYKVYTSDGVQAVPSHTEKISSLMGKSFRVNKTARVQPVPKQVEERYIERLVRLVGKHVEGSTKIVYSPLQGTGARFVPKVLRELGCDVICVEQQMEFDPNFS